MTEGGVWSLDWTWASEQVSPVLHGGGVVLSVSALVLRGVSHPAVGFPIAIGVLIGVELLAADSGPETRAVLRVISGGPASGGKKQGATIKFMFAVALLYAASYPFVVGSGEPVLADLLLGVALLGSGIGTGIEAKAIDAVIATRERGEA